MGLVEAQSLAVSKHPCIGDSSNCNFSKHPAGEKMAAVALNLDWIHVID